MALLRNRVWLVLLAAVVVLMVAGLAQAGERVSQGKVSVEKRLLPDGAGCRAIWVDRRRRSPERRRVRGHAEHGNRRSFHQVQQRQPGQGHRLRLSGARGQGPQVPLPGGHGGALRGQEARHPRSASAAGLASETTVVEIGRGARSQPSSCVFLRRCCGRK